MEMPCVTCVALVWDFGGCWRRISLARAGVGSFLVPRFNLCVRRRTEAFKATLMAVESLS